MSHLDKNPSEALQKLVSRTAAGEIAAFGSLYRMFFMKLLRYGNVIVPDTDLVEDSIQDLFAWILENPEKLHKVHNIEVYLFQSLKKNLRDHIKTTSRKAVILRQIPNGQSFQSKPENIEQKMIREENRHFNRCWVKQRIEELPPRQKEIIFLRYYEGLSYDEIAEICCTSNQVVRNYTSRALKRIRKLTGKLNEFLMLFLLWLFVS